MRMSASRACRASASTALCTATVVRPMALAVRITRQAISPRLAISRVVSIVVVPAWPGRLFPSPWPSPPRGGGMTEWGREMEGTRSTLMDKHGRVGLASWPEPCTKQPPRPFGERAGVRGRMASQLQPSGIFLPARLALLQKGFQPLLALGADANAGYAVFGVTAQRLAERSAADLAQQ